MSNWTFSRAKTCRGEEYDTELVKEADELRKAARGMLDRLTKELFSRNPQSFLRDMAEMKPIFAMLIEVIKSFGLRFDQVKEEKGLVDFFRSEHLCLEYLSR